MFPYQTVLRDGSCHFRLILKFSKKDVDLSLLQDLGVHSIEVQNQNGDYIWAGTFRATSVLWNYLVEHRSELNIMAPQTLQDELRHLSDH